MKLLSRPPRGARATGNRQIKGQGPAARGPARSGSSLGKGADPESARSQPRLVLPAATVQPPGGLGSGTRRSRAGPRAAYPGPTRGSDRPTPAQRASPARLRPTLAGSAGFGGRAEETGGGRYGERSRTGGDRAAGGAGVPVM